MHIACSAPTRIDLAGGTIDIWPLYLFHDGATTLNAAISLRAHADIAARSDGRVELPLIAEGDSEITVALSRLGIQVEGAPQLPLSGWEIVDLQIRGAQRLVSDGIARIKLVGRLEFFERPLRIVARRCDPEVLVGLGRDHAAAGRADHQFPAQQIRLQPGSRDSRLLLQEAALHHSGYANP